MTRRNPDNYPEQKSDEPLVPDTDELRAIARTSDLSFSSCQLCEDAADEIDRLRDILDSIQYTEIMSNTTAEW